MRPRTSTRSVRPKSWMDSGEANSWGSGRDVRFGVKVVADNRSLDHFRMDSLYIHDIFPTPVNGTPCTRGTASTGDPVQHRTPQVQAHAVPFGRGRMPMAARGQWWRPGLGRQRCPADHRLLTTPFHGWSGRSHCPDHGQWWCTTVRPFPFNWGQCGSRCQRLATNGPFNAGFRAETLDSTP